MFSCQVLTLLCAATIAFAAPIVEVTKRQSTVYDIPGDAPYSLSEAQLQAALNCPNGNTASNMVMLGPGTGEPTEDSYNGNWAKLLPANGYNFCYLIIPGISEGDAQITSEYFAYGVNYLNQTTGGPIRVLTHSQGGLNMQWAFTFWPSTRKSVKSFTPMAPDYKGTTVAQTLIDAQESSGGSVPAVWQQNFGSNYVTALANHGGLQSFVPTTNIHTLTDEVVEPQTGPNASPILSGASNIALQDICPDALADHILIITNVITEYLVLSAYKSSTGMADASTISAVNKALLCANQLPQFNDVDGTIGFTAGALISVITIGAAANKVTSEPPLMAYAQ